MCAYQPPDFSPPCEVVKLYGTYEHEATIFRKPNGEIEVHEACLVSNQQELIWNGKALRYDRNLKIVTTSGNLVAFKRRWTGEYQTITPGYTFGEVVHVPV